eukprot:CAMPEP_0175065878 /NCGR_PEP_ID=MMETSP0052_2-20121109/16187_1 /TAXON_ID=51329 ORGANISM="Polytomella parva, Strain SAG 63-3" /NCGR_SAMPLE_ID=MMETSP0052_2 /ASSEMBLY_ACC=CAM_ASM_000194 /LENGTH=346 /DNA_ID=CAMNT_0016332497 /DNA_START=59 /DNA_END=1099 /DNA_ORIENTATION=-
MTSLTSAYNNESRNSTFVVAAAALGLGVSSVLVKDAYADAQAPQEATEDPYAKPTTVHPLPGKIILYQYKVCPYCCKVKALLDYYKLPYQIIEVNPLTKGELKWSTYKKVPVIKLDDEVVLDSSAIMSRLAADVAAARLPASSSIQAKPASPAPAADQPGFFARLFGSKPTPQSDDDDIPFHGVPADPAALTHDAIEELHWRKWVDDRLVKLLTANIYKSWDDSVETFRYITSQTNWSWGTRELARWIGAILMWQVGKRLPSKYGIEGDIREALFAAIEEFVVALDTRAFLGGSTPNVADLSVFGVLRAVEDTPTFKDIMDHTGIKPWFSRMQDVVGPSAGFVEAL